MNGRKLLRRFGYGVLVLLLCGAGYGLYFYFEYPGFVKDFVADLRYASFAQIRTKYEFLLYYAEYYEMLKLNPQTGMYDLEAAAEEYRKDGRVNDFERGKLSFHRGDFGSAIREIESDIRARGETETKLFWLAMSQLRFGEVENCLPQLTGRPLPSQDPMGMANHSHHISTGVCSLPIKSIHEKPAGAQAAAKSFEKLLDHYSGRNKLYQWLLNFSYMALGRFPEGVPSRYLIKSDFIDQFYGEKRKEVEARYAYLKFQDRAKEFGIDTYDAGKGVAVEDFNGDGFLDIVTGGTFSETRYYQNDRGMGFVDKTAESGLSKATQAYMITAADYDNDGNMDVFVSRPFQSFVLLRNNGNGTFTDVTISSGLLKGEPKPDEAIYSCVPAWADVDNDGDLDLFVAQFGQKVPWTKGLLGRKPMSSRLFINEKGRFEDRTDEYGLHDVVADNIYVGATFGDYDRDGWPDLFLSSPSRARSILLKNNGGRRFEETNLVDTREPGFMATFLDINHDGRLDLFQGSQGTALGDSARTVFGVDTDKGRNKIFLQKDGSFENRGDLFGGRMPIGTMGVSFGDVNNDGCVDFYLGTGSPEGWFVLPNLMYVGEVEGTNCTGRMANVSMLHGFGTIQKGHAVVFFDFNNDGKQDVYSSLGGMWPGDSWPNQFFVNESDLDRAWVKIRLRGRKTNHFGVGAMIKVVAENAGNGEIIRYHHVDEATGFGSAPYLAHVGLLDATRITRIEVYWPASRQTKSYAGNLRELNVLDEEDGTVQ